MIRKLPFYCGIALLIVCFLQVVFLKNVYGAVDTVSDNEVVEVVENEEVATSENVPVIIVETDNNDETGEHVENVESEESSEEVDSDVSDMVVSETVFNEDNGSLQLLVDIKTGIYVSNCLIVVLCGVVSGVAVMKWFKGW